MANNKKQNGLILLLVGAGLILLMFQSGGLDVAREAKPVFDGQQNVFELDLVKHRSQAVVGDGTYWIKTRVTNPAGKSDGSMWVQCSILDKDDNEWLNRLAGVNKIGVESNCVADEPYTQTAKVSLNAGEFVDVIFTVTVPDAVGGKDVIFCEAFEQCYDMGDTLVSDNLVEDITISSSSSGSPSVTPSGEEDVCEEDKDCKSFLFDFWSETKCIEEKCVDKEDVEEAINIDWPDTSDAALKGWISDHKVFVFLAALLLVIIGTVWVYKTPRQPKIRTY